MDGSKKDEIRMDFTHYFLLGGKSEEVQFIWKMCCYLGEVIDLGINIITRLKRMAQTTSCVSHVSPFTICKKYLGGALQLSHDSRTCPTGS